MSDDGTFADGNPNGTAYSEPTTTGADADDLIDPSADGTTFTGEDLVIGYPGTDEPVVDGESVVPAPSEVTALVGPNGSGKSTLLKALADQIEPESGTVVLNGQSVQSFDSKELARQLGLLSQENVAPNSLTVEKLVTHGRYPHRSFYDRLTEEDRTAVDRAIEQAARFADYIIALDDGEVYDWGPPEDVLTEQLLADVFAVDATVVHDPLRVSPRRALDDG